jgi:hypothetical protein
MKMKVYVATAATALTVLSGAPAAHAGTSTVTQTRSATYSNPDRCWEAKYQLWKAWVNVTPSVEADCFQEASNRWFFLYGP